MKNLKKTLNQKLKPITRRLSKQVGSIPRGMMAFIAVSLALHASLVVMGRRMASNPRTEPTHEIREKRSVRPSETRPLRLNLAGLKTVPLSARPHSKKTVIAHRSSKKSKVAKRIPSLKKMHRHMTKLASR